MKSQYKNIFFSTILTAVLLACVLSLLSGASWLLFRLNILFGFHTGTALAWIALVCCSLIAIRLNNHYRFMRYVSSFSFYISIFWLLLSYLLSGNNNLLFSGSTHNEFVIWIFITFFPIFVFFISLIYYLIKLLKSKKYNKI